MILLDMSFQFCSLRKQASSGAELWFTHKASSYIEEIVIHE